MKIENASSVYFDMRAVLYFYNGKDVYSLSDMCFSSATLMILIFLPSIAIIFSLAKAERVLMALLVVILDMFASSSLLRKMLMV